ncbi:BspA family leucine-rich repeat surface protein [Schleiferilactobacillus harbinensis]|uniref:BspA family leucine-rich repeat surface protein n=1 Tax=Schleiferilactobacillus harbinensis TaxID=304207 RepID=A0A5P8M4S9_9LACO|nr:BspA family leucine-rich repeat surface protein [Schleiferilactobacillus harbinensis]QFR23518.1 BspA family leucine-rich repeat surface protein [Schleiferilactobacillus harbinensis]
MKFTTLIKTSIWGILVFFLFLLNAPTATAASSLSSSGAPALSQGLFPVQSTKTPSIANTISSLITATAAQLTTENAPAPEDASTDWWDISTDGTLTIHSGHTLSFTDTHGAQWQTWPWTDQASTIKKAVIEPGVSAEQTLGFLFAGCTNLTDVEGLSNIKVNTVTTPGHPAVNTLAMMFQNCKSLTTINLDGLDTSSVTSMDSMFSGCSALTNLNLTKLDTSSATYMGNMFDGCSALTNLNVSNFDTSNVTYMGYMFSGCGALTSLDLGSFNTSHVTNMFHMFDSCSKLTSLDLSTFDAHQVTNTDEMFRYCSALKQLTFGKEFVTSRVTNMFCMFLGCSSLPSLDLSTFNTSQVINMQQMFNSCNSLVQLDLSSFDTHNVTDMGFMFNGCSKLAKLNVTSFDTSKVSSMQFLFNACSSLTNLDVRNFDTSNVTDMHFMFASDSNLSALDLTSFNTSKVTSMSWMFHGDSALQTLNLTPSKFNTGQVTTMNSMFWACNSLTAVDVSQFDTSSVVDMAGMFGGCNQVRTLAVSNFNTSLVTNMSQMFYACSALTQLDLHNFDTRKVTDMFDMMRDCTSLTQANVTGFNTSAVTRISGFFMNDRKLLTADLSSFDVRTLSNHDVGDMFANCTSLWKVSVGDKAQLGQGNNGNLPPHSAGAIAQNSPDPYTAGAGWQELGTAANPLEANGPQFSASGNSVTPGTLMYLLSQPRAGTVNPATGKAVWTYVWQPQRWWNITGDTLNIGTQPHALNLTNDKYSTNNSWPWSSQADATGVKHINLAATGLSAQGSISGLFKGLSNVTDIANLPDLDASKATDTSDMFNGCAALTSLDLSTLDTRRVTTETGMFTGTTHLWQLKLGPNFKTTTDNLGLGGPVAGTVISSTDAAGQAHSYTIQATDTAWQELGSLGTLLSPAGDTYTPTDLMKLYNDGTRPTTVQTYVWQQTGAGTIGLSMTGSFDYGKHFQPIFGALDLHNLQPFALTVTDTRADRAQMQWHVDATGSDFVSDDDPVKVSPNPWRFNAGNGVLQPMSTPITIWQNTSTSTDTTYPKNWDTNPFELDFPVGSVPQIGKYHATITFTLANGLS